MGDGGGTGFLLVSPTLVFASPYAAATLLLFVRGCERLRRFPTVCGCLRDASTSWVAPKSADFIIIGLRDTEWRLALRLPEYGECAPIAAVAGL